MKWLKVLLCAVMIVAVFTVPCLATNEGVYGHHIPAGEYRFNPVLSFDMLGTNVEYSAGVPFVSNDTSYDVLRVAVNSVGELVYYQVGSNTSSAANVYISNDQYTTWADPNYRYINVTEDFIITDSALYYFWVKNAQRIDGGDDGLVLDVILGHFLDVGQWVSESAEDLSLMFWNSTDETLTFVGSLAVAGLAFSVSFLIIGLIQRFLKFKG